MVNFSIALSAILFPIFFPGNPFYFFVKIREIVLILPDTVTLIFLFSFELGLQCGTLYPYPEEWDS